MNYSVVHYEEYVDEKTTTVYNGIGDFLEKYPVNEETFYEVDELPEKVGETSYLRYDHYITLEVTAL